MIRVDPKRRQRLGVHRDIGPILTVTVRLGGVSLRQVRAFAVMLDAPDDTMLLLCVSLLRNLHQLRSSSIDVPKVV